MAEAKPCIICGKLTTRLLFRDARLGVYICSRRCELEHFESLRHKKKEQKKLLRYLDGKIARTKKYGQSGWATAAIGLVLITLGAFLARFSVTKNLEVGVSLFIIGTLVVTCGALSTSYFADRKRKLTETRRKIA